MKNGVAEGVACGPHDTVAGLKTTVLFSSEELFTSTSVYYFLQGITNDSIFMFLSDW